MADVAAVPPRPLWRNRDYMILWSGQAVSQLGSGISGIAYPLLILALTGSAAWTGFAFATGSLPYLIFSLPAGALVDRWDRKWVMMVCDTGRALSAASIPLAALLGHLTLLQLFVVAVWDGTLFVFFNLAEVAALPRVVPSAQLPSASAQNEAAQTATLLVAPGLGGFIFQTVSHTAPWIFDSISYAASVFSLALIRTPFRQEAAPAPRRLAEEIREGVSWLWGQPLIRYMAFLTGGLNFGNEASYLVVLVLARQLHASAFGIGLMFALASAGGLLGALLAPRLQRRFSFAGVIVSTVWLDALLLPLLLLAPNPALLGVIFGLSWLAGPVYNAVQFGYRLQIIPDALQGRVNSAFRLMAFGFQPVGAALAGLLIQDIGVSATVLIFAGVRAGLAILTTFNPQVRHARPAVS